jgi:two-component system, NarL family, invasion response regulator UvrY
MGFFPLTFCVLWVVVPTCRSTILAGILVVDDHPVIAKACSLVLEPIGIEKIISAYDIDTGYQAFLEHEPDVSVIDLSLDGKLLDGIALIKRIRSHDARARILVFSMRADRSSFVAAIEAGATGYLIKDSPIEEFAKAVEQTRLGRRYIDPQLALNLAFPENAALSPRERQILDLLMEDMSSLAFSSGAYE